MVDDLLRHIHRLERQAAEARAGLRDWASEGSARALTQAVRVARKGAKVVDFRFHDYRHSAKTAWSRQGVHVDVAMKAAGHKSVAMHQRYVDLKPGDVAKAFGILQHGCNTDSPASKPKSASS